MFTPQQAPSSILHGGAIINAPTLVKDVAALIHQVLCDDTNNSDAENTLSATFATEAGLYSLENLDKLYSTLLAPDLQELQRHYDTLTTVTADNALSNLPTLYDNQDSNFFLVCNVASDLHLEPQVQCLNGIHFLQDRSHPLNRSIIG